MLDALADRVDRGIAGAQIVADQEPAIDVEPGRAREVDIGPDADRHHDQIGGDLPAIGEDHALGLVGAENLLGLRRW